MKVSYQWLSELVDIDGISPEQLANRLTNVGLAVDGIEARNKGLKDVVVGEVKTCLEHPAAERLHVCEVDVGTGEWLTIVCGAPNVAVGQKVPTALPGAVLPGGAIQKVTLRGVESNGMLCSAEEIGLEVRLLPKAQTDGLFILPEDAKVGADVVPILHLDDSVLEIDLTPNRSDCLSMRGLAYEVAAVFERPLRNSDFFADPIESQQAGETERENGGGEEAEPPVRVRLETERCPRYEAQVLTGTRPRPSPLWLQMRLLAMGVRPINQIVDVTNVVMLEWGQPLHAFDLDEVHAQTIVVRQGGPDETLVTLDGETRVLTEDTICIADVDRAIGIAGVMGGENSEVTKDTDRIVLESAVFDPSSVRRTGQRLGLRSEAQQRFEKGIDPIAVRGALMRAVQLLEQLAGARCVGGVVSVETTSPEGPRKVSFSPDGCNQILGTSISTDVMEQIFQRLGFHVHHLQAAKWDVEVPTRRPDIRIEADLVEEIGRLYGLDLIPPTLPYGPTTVGVRTASQKLRKRTREVLLGTGMSEVFTYTLTQPSLLDALLIPLDSPYRRMIPLLRPMSDERTVLRTHMLPGLAQVAHYNLTHGVLGGEIFEIGRVYVPERLPIDTQPAEPTLWSGLWFGQNEPQFGGRPRKYDFFDAKGTIETWLNSLGFESDVRFERGRENWLHPGRSSQVTLAGTVVGSFGELHPQTASALEIGPAVYAEFNLDLLLSFVRNAWRVEGLPKFPGSRRDLAVVVDEAVAAGDLLEAARELSRKSKENLLESCWVFDVYTGKGISEGKKSIAVAFRYRSDERTLTESEIAELEGRILSFWESAYKAQLRTF